MNKKIGLLFCWIFLNSVFLFAQDIKNTGLSGLWYPDNPNILTKEINQYLQKANPPKVNGKILALISPHAGLSYSGPIGAYGFKAVQNQKIDTVIVVGFSHQKHYDGTAIFDKDGIKTRLGTLYCDKNLVNELLRNKTIFSNEYAFDDENSIELILPFIQVSLKSPKIALLAIGDQNWETVKALGESLYEALKNKENFLIIASTDMSHYLPYNEAKQVDRSTISLIAQLDPEKLFKQCAGKNFMCGTNAVTSVMIAARKLGANNFKALDSRNSGDITGERAKVVGYLSAAFIKEKEITQMDETLNLKEKNKLLKLARDTIKEYINNGKVIEAKEDDPLLNKKMGAFVTLHKNGQLRGCIGNIIGEKPLYLTVRDMAIASSTEDPRFTPLTKEEIKDIHIEISVLTEPKKITNPDEIILGTHGVIVKQGFRSGVYLPQVATETGWSKEEFMNSLCSHKAGIPEDAWKKGNCEIYIFSAQVFEE